jgi:hypothetical protein
MVIELGHGFRDDDQVFPHDGPPIGCCNMFKHTQGNTANYFGLSFTLHSLGAAAATV